MDMNLDSNQYQNLDQRLDQRPSPTLVTFTQILALSSYDLLQAIQQEISDNPALELVDSENNCMRCGERLVISSCPRCDGLGDDDWQETIRSQDYDEDFDPFTLIASQMSLSEALMRELVMVLPKEDFFIADYLCGSLDESGLLDTTTREVANTLGVDEKRVEAVLEELQNVGPLGVGARSVQECLDIQLRRWEELGEAPALVRPIIEMYLVELGEGKYGYIATQLGVDYEEVIKARDFIRNHLRPFPIAEVSENEHWRSVSDVPFIAPDIVISATEDNTDDFEVTVVESRRASLRVNTHYSELAEQIGQSENGLSGDEADHIRSHVSRARSFTSHINERRRTMKRVATYVVERQTDFLRHGWRELRPLTRAEVADALDLHESTVSRATADKYVMLPSGQVIPFAKFFQAALSVQDVLREIIEKENEPLTDAQLVEQLREAGYQVARRTVAKYRNQMGILPSSLR
ncbi:MAG: RNA polymerase factor sigma-54 [Ardenticatenales bacterium]|nr:RNA polymerase factor sigma-54 [Ardenticatenales bacterium]